MKDRTTPKLDEVLGRSQAFSLIRSRCSAAQAESVKQIREGKLYESLGLTWEEFCPTHLGIHRSYADKLIQQLEEFGAEYFRLCEIVRISPETYRSIKPAVAEQYINIDGERIPITPENGRRIRAAVTELRSRLIEARGLCPTFPSIIDLQTRLDDCFEQMRQLRRNTADPGTLAAVSGLIHYAQRKLGRIEKDS
jgi:hypothetical protein